MVLSSSLVSSALSLLFSVVSSQHPPPLHPHHLKKIESENKQKSNNKICFCIITIKLFKFLFYKICDLFPVFSRYIICIFAIWLKNYTLYELFPINVSKIVPFCANFNEYNRYFFPYSVHNFNDKIEISVFLVFLELRLSNSYFTFVIVFLYSINKLQCQKNTAAIYFSLNF